jgi:hypothetical protein
VVRSLEEIDSLLDRATPIGASTAAATLRGWRTVLVSYAIGVLSLDVEILNRGTGGLSEEEVLAARVDDLPDILANGWVGGGWSLSPDATASVAAAAEVEDAMDQSDGLLRLHADVVLSDLADPDAVAALRADVEQLRAELVERRGQLESRIRQIQEVVRLQYASGAASVDDWLA